MTIQNSNMLVANKVKDCMRQYAMIGRVVTFKEVVEDITDKCFTEVPKKLVQRYLKCWERNRKTFLGEIRNELLAAQAQLIEGDDFPEVPMTFVHRVEQLQCDSIGADSMRYLSMGHGFNAQTTGKQPVSEAHKEYVQRAAQAAKAHRIGQRPTHGKVVHVALPFKAPMKTKLRKAS